MISVNCAISVGSEFPVPAAPSFCEAGPHACAKNASLTQSTFPTTNLPINQAVQRYY